MSGAQGAFAAAFAPARAGRTRLADRAERDGAGSHGPVCEPGTVGTAARPCHEARALTHGGDTAEIVHGGQTYTLRITRLGKLILTK